MSADDKAAAAWDDYIDQQQQEKIEELERQLNAANAKIKRLVEAGDRMEEWLIWSFGPQFKRHTTALAWIKSKESKS